MDRDRVRKYVEKRKEREWKNTGKIYEAGIGNGENYTRGHMITKEFQRGRARERSCEG